LPGLYLRVAAGLSPGCGGFVRIVMAGLKPGPAQM